MLLSRTLFVLLAWALLLPQVEASPALEPLKAGPEVALYQTVSLDFEYSGWQGNPFDVVSLVTMVHLPSKQKRVTELVYLGQNRWQFRFTGTEQGEWRWRTLSEHAALNDLSGKITVTAQPDPLIKGFLTHRGNQFARPNHKGEMEGVLFFVWMNYVEYATDNQPQQSVALAQFKQASRFDAYLDDAWKHGFDTVFVSVGEPDLWMRSNDVRAKPNLETFELLDKLIVQAHRRGMRVHIWQWKDESRGATPHRYAGGINGPVDRRLLRYIAARLGPLPGWSMSYGFDLHEWVSSEEVNAWADYLHDHMGWDHLLASRGYQLHRSGNNINSYDGYGRDVQLTTSYAGPKSYTEIRQHMEADDSRPHLYEERHTYGRPRHDLDMEGSRRLLWWSAMAGGMGGFMGFFAEDSGAFGGYPYPKPKQLKIFGDFWRQHWRLGLEVCNQNTNAYGLCADGRYLFYRTAAKKIKFKLRDVKGRVPVKALNTVTGEWLDLGMRSGAFQEFVAPRRSDWVLAIGRF